MKRSSPEGRAGQPPERRCTATVGSHQANAGHRCTNWTIKDLDVCSAHAKRSIPSHQPPPERRCQSKAQDADGHRTQPCKLWAMKGLTVCWRHGGANRATRAAGDRRVAEDKIEKKARKLADLFDVEPVDNPLEALAQHVGEEIVFKDILAGLVKELSVDDIRYTDARGAEQLRSEVVVFERALGRVGDRLVAYAKLGIDERLVKIEEGKAAMVMDAINAVIGYFAEGGTDPGEARQIGARHLRAAPQ